MTTSDILDVLNLLTAKRNQLYYVWAIDSNTIHFSNHIKKVKEFFLSEKTVYKLTAWQQVIDPRDYDYLVTKIEKLVKRKTDSYNFNYRVQGYWGESIWVNDNGRFVYGENGALLYTVGCMMLGEDTKPGETVFHNHELKKEIDEILHTGQQGYLLFIGIDNLKMINLKNGRDFGDEILRTVTQSIETELPSSQKVFRINGDWFAVNLFVETEKEVARFFERVQARLFAHCTVSGGCVSFTDYHVDNAGTLLQYAETSLDYSKNHGKNRLTFFSPENYEERLRELELREDLKKSIETDFAGFSLVFQGQYYTETYELYGAEALLRYQSPRRGNVSPVEFVPLLEKSNMMYPVGLWVIREALKYCRQWRKNSRTFISVSICRTGS